MKKNIVRVLSLLLVAAMLFVCASCTQKIEVRFVDKDGNDIQFGAVTPNSGNDNTTAATDAVTTTAAPESTTASADTPSTTAGGTDTSTTAGGTDTSTTAAPTSTTAAPTSTVPTTKDEIIAFYAKAVNDIKNNGTAGYTKKEYQTMGELNVTGLGAVDNAIKGVASNYFKGEDQVEPQVSAKGSGEAKDRMLGWNLTDNSKVKSATYDAATGALTIVMVDEDTPHKGGSSHLDQVGSVLLWEDIDAELQNVSILSAYDNIHVVYTNYTITATLSQDGKFSALKHHTDVAINIGSAKILIATLKDKNVSLENTVVFSDFQY